MNAAANAIDSSVATRWESLHQIDPSWLYVDLGATKSIDGVVLDWESASARQYTISVAADGATGLSTDAPWTNLYTSPTNLPSGNHRLDTIPTLHGVGRYVRMKGLSRTTAYGYSLWDFAVIGTHSLSCVAEGGADAGADAGD
jgi:hypothetical protein